MASLFDRAKPGRRGVIYVRSGSPAIGDVKKSFNRVSIDKTAAGSPSAVKPAESSGPDFSWAAAAQSFERLMSSSNSGQKHQAK